MRGDILEILGVPVKFWTHVDELNGNFSTGVYENQAVFLRGEEGHTGWANRALLKRAGVTSGYLRTLSEADRSYYGAGKDLEPDGFVVDAGMKKLFSLPKPTTRGFAALARRWYNYSLESPHGLIRC
jgi:predicted amidohydrolase YtcJ